MAKKKDKAAAKAPLFAVAPGSDEVEFILTWQGADGDLMKLVDNGHEVALTGPHKKGIIGVRYFPPKDVVHDIEWDFWGEAEVTTLAATAKLNGGPAVDLDSEDGPVQRWRRGGQLS
jgi:hypothetical protein